MSWRFVALIALAWSLGASGAEWRAAAAGNQLTFTATLQGTAVPGEFKHFDVVLRSDGDRPDGGSLDVTVDTRSAVTGLPDVDRALPTPPWLDTAAHPSAEFHAAALARRGEGDYLARGVLTLKGARRDLDLPIAWRVVNDVTTIEGEVRLARLAFDIGSGEWTATDSVADEVTVHFVVALVRQP